jgi:positive regulator of sigma E activity
MGSTKSHEPSSKRADTGLPRPHTVGERVSEWLVPERNPAGAVYGIITIGALLAAESGLRETYPQTVGSVSIAVVLYWFAHSYADVLGLRLTEQRRLTSAELWHTFVQDWSIVRGASAPLMALLIAWLAGAEQTTAVTAAVWTAVASLIAFELAAGLRARSKPRELALEVLVGATMGLALLVLRALLH